MIATHDDPPHASRPVLALSGSTLFTSGLDPPALLAAVATGETVWFSEGTASDAQDLRVIACASRELLPDVTASVPIRGLVSSLLGDGVWEYALTSQISLHFGDAPGDGVREIARHRHCTSLTPASQEVLHRVLEGVLRQFGFVPERVARWQAAPGALVKLLHAYPAIRLELAHRDLALATISVEVPCDPPCVDDRLRPAVLSSTFRSIGHLELEIAGGQAVLHPVRPPRQAAGQAGDGAGEGHPGAPHRLP